jgi:hypothetical protein
MMQTDEIVLGYHVSHTGLKVDPLKIEIISKFPIPLNQRDVRSLLGYVGNYHRFIEFLLK